MAKTSGLGAVYYSETIVVCGVEMNTVDIRHLVERLIGPDPLGWRSVVPLLTVDDLRWIDSQLAPI